MNCVVCEQPIAAGAERYASTWESARKRFPCCSDACAAKFDPDVHWIPAVAPAPADEAEQTRLLGITRARLYQGDLATVIAHEMLLAGVSPVALRRVLTSGYVDPGKPRRFLLFKLGDRRDRSSIKAALADLDRWEARYPATP